MTITIFSGVIMEKKFFNVSSKKPFLLLSLAVIAALAACQNVDKKSQSSEEPEYNIVRPSITPDYDTYAVGAAPAGFNMTYYSDIYSRGFSYLTDLTASETNLYLVQSDKGEQADFTNAQVIEGTALEIEYNKDGNLTTKDGSLAKKKGSSNDVTLNLYSHKVHVENLEKGKAYSYKVGSDAGWTYGAFITEKEKAKSITAIHMSDAQTKDQKKLNVWRNTFTKAVDTAGKGLDMALYNGDQFDQNNSTGSAGKPSRVLRHLKAIEIINDYKFDIPYMASSGNHEPSVPYINYFTGDINYADVSDSGCYYSYDYDYAHFAVLNTNDVSTTQVNWLKEDLDKASNAKWKVVMLHISPYSTGDHTNNSENQRIVEKLTPVFSEKHVDLVLQAHDHTYNRTLPYKWDSAGYTTEYNNAEVVNLNPATETIEDVEYDKNPQGTYYVTTGAAGHRCGQPEADEGIWAEAVKDEDEWKGLNPNQTFFKNKYKIELGKLKYDSQLEPFKYSSYEFDEIYNKGDLATGCVNAQMFGVLELTETTLRYKVYTAKEDQVHLFDSLDVLKA